MEIREMEKGDDLVALENIQREAWNLQDITIVPSHLLEAMVHYKAGFVAAAFSEGRAVGFILALHTKNPKVEHMHMIGVTPVFQGGRGGTNVGEKLMRFYGDEASRRSVEEIEWTFDPLLGQNANLYLHKLGARVLRYEPAAYSQSSETGIYSGIPPDRLLVRWRVGTYPPRDSFRLPDRLIESSHQIDDENFALEVASDIGELKSRDKDAAIKLRLNSRTIFLKSLETGYKVADFLHQNETGRNFYIFELSCH